MRVMTGRTARSLELVRRRLYDVLETPEAEPEPLPTTRRWNPPTDVWLLEEAVVIEMELTETPREAVQVEVEGESVTITGARERTTAERERRYHQVERPRGPFARTLTFPWPLEAAGAQATLRRGLLTVRVPLAERGAE
jgi:HSP20 family protein